MSNVIPFEPRRTKRARDRWEDTETYIREAVQVGYATDRVLAAYVRRWGVDEHVLHQIHQNARAEAWRAIERTYMPGGRPYRDRMAELAGVDMDELIFAIEGGFRDSR